MFAALVCLALVYLVTLAFFATLARRWLMAAHRREAAWSAERRELLDRIMYMSGNPWVLPKGETEPEPPPDTETLIYHDLLPEESWQ